jgi:uncharacterized membrane protein YsdA (DUF1294 family)
MRPEKFHGLLALALSALVALALLAVLPFLSFTRLAHLLGAWLVGVSVITFLYYGYDKARAGRGSGRVPEVVLHGLALVGGSAGAYLGMHFFRHKTVKGRFRFVFWCIVVLQGALLTWLGYHAWQHR